MVSADGFWRGGDVHMNSSSSSGGWLVLEVAADDEDVVSVPCGNENVMLCFKSNFENIYQFEGISQRYQGK